MHWGSPEFVLAIIAISTGGWQLDATHQRLANVEAIVTDRGFDVASQIEALRPTHEQGRAQ